MLNLDEQLIGRTPMLYLKKVIKGYVAKLEIMETCCSVKDRLNQILPFSSFI